MMVLLVDASTCDVELGGNVASELGRLGVTSISLLRDRATVGIVLEGWLFDPARSGAAAVAAIGASGRTRRLYPVMQTAVSAATC
jgi:hypothetical protein